MTEAEKERINELLLSSSEDDNKLAISILISKRKSVKFWIRDLYIPYYSASYRSDKWKTKIKLTSYCQIIKTTNANVISVQLKNKWINYIKTLKS